MVHSNAKKYKDFDRKWLVYTAQEKKLPKNSLENERASSDTFDINLNSLFSTNLREEKTTSKFQQCIANLEVAHPTNS